MCCIMFSSKRLQTLTSVMPKGIFPIYSRRACRLSELMPGTCVTSAVTTEAGTTVRFSVGIWPDATTYTIQGGNGGMCQACWLLFDKHHHVCVN